MSAEGSSLSDQNSIRAIALRIAVSSVTPVSGGYTDLPDGVIQRRALTYESFIKRGEF